MRHTKTQNAQIRRFKEFRERTGISFSTEMSGKMSGMVSLSTSPHGERCKANAERYEVCKHCYAKTCDAMYPALHKNLMQNLEILTTTEIAVDDWVRINYNAWRCIRLESFGDVNNTTQIVNYFNLAKANPKITFTVWTKNIDLYYQAIEQGNSKPNNLIIIASSPMLNVAIRIPAKYAGIVNKVFTVYTYDYIRENKITPCFINCGARSCVGCKRCYRFKDGVEYVNEILKSDSRRVHKMWAANGWVGTNGNDPHIKGIPTDVVAQF